MQKIATILILVLVSTLAQAKVPNSDMHPNSKGKFVIHELIVLPHPGKVLKLHAKEIGINKIDLMRIKKEVKSVYAPLLQEKIRLAYELEKKVKRMVVAGKTKTEVKNELDKIAQLKREAIDYKIDALNKFREILGEKRWKKMLDLENN